MPVPTGSSPSIPNPGSSHSFRSLPGCYSPLSLPSGGHRRGNPAGSGSRSHRDHCHSPDSVGRGRTAGTFQLAFPNFEVRAILGQHNGGTEAHLLNPADAESGLPGRDRVAISVSLRCSDAGQRRGGRRRRRFGSHSDAAGDVRPGPRSGCRARDVVSGSDDHSGRHLHPGRPTPALCTVPLTST